MSTEHKLGLIRAIKLILLLLTLIPSFTNFFLTKMPSTVIPGVSLWQLLYFFIVLLVVRVVAGYAIFFFSLSAVSLLSLPVVFVGAIVSCLKRLPAISNEQIFRESPHYISLLLNMLTVVPLAIGLMSQIPLRRYEMRLLNRTRGVTFREKILLMAARVINHILFTVIPNILQVRREERYKGSQVLIEEFANDFLLEKAKEINQRVIRCVIEMLDIAVASICFSVEHITIWAIEIGNLPSKQAFKEYSNGKEQTSQDTG